MQRAAKNKTIWVAILALASLLPSSATASSGLDQGVQNRVELFLRGAQNGTERHPFEPAKHVENYDPLGAIASGSPIAPKGGALTEISAWKLADESPANVSRLARMYGVMMKEFRGAGGTMNVTDKLGPFPLRGGHFDWVGGRNHIDLFGSRSMGTRFEELKHFFQVQKLRKSGMTDLEISAMRGSIEGDAHRFMEALGFVRETF